MPFCPYVLPIRIVRDVSTSKPSTLFLEIIVVNLYAEGYNRAYRRDYVGNDQGPVTQGNALNYKENRPQAEHTEGRHRNAVGIACANSGYGLWQIAKNHANTG